MTACRSCGLLDASAAACGRALALDPKIRTSVGHTWFLQRDYARVASIGVVLDYPYIVALSMAEPGHATEAVAALRELEPKVPARVLDFVIAARTLVEGNVAEKSRRHPQRDRVRFSATRKRSAIWRATSPILAIAMRPSRCWNAPSTAGSPVSRRSNAIVARSAERAAGASRRCSSGSGSSRSSRSGVHQPARSSVPQAHDDGCYGASPGAIAVAFVPPENRMPSASQCIDRSTIIGTPLVTCDRGAEGRVRQSRRGGRVDVEAARWRHRVGLHDRRRRLRAGTSPVTCAVCCLRVREQDVALEVQRSASAAFGGEAPCGVGAASTPKLLCASPHGRAAPGQHIERSAMIGYVRRHHRRDRRVVQPRVVFRFDVRSSDVRVRRDRLRRDPVSPLSGGDTAASPAPVWSADCSARMNVSKNPPVAPSREEPLVGRAVTPADA